MKTVAILLLCMISLLVGVSNETPQNERFVSNIQSRISSPNLQALPTVVVNMIPSYNGTTLTSFATALAAIPYTYGSSTNLKYRFSITNVTTGVTVADIIQTSRFVYIPASIHSTNSQYTIKVSAVIDDVVYDFAGNTITVFGPSAPLITLGPTTCGITLATLTSTLVADVGLNAITYTFRIRLASDTSGTNYGYSSSPSRFVSADSFTGFPLLYGTLYKVAVQYTFPDPSTGIITNSGYGGECSIETPKIPSVGLASPVCDSSVSSLTANMTAYPGPYATFYQFRIRKTSDIGGPYTVTTPNASRFSSLAAFGITLSYNTSYSISVRYSISANASSSRSVWSGYGPECIIKTPVARTTDLSFKATAYPNPFANNFKIDVKTVSNSVVKLKVYDLAGRLVEQREVPASDMENTTIGDYYSSGVYNLIVSQEENVQTLRVVKK